MNAPTPRRVSLAVWTCLALTAIAVAYGFWGYSYDDNYITYRYARNWLRGDGLVFNPGERVFGTSAPGYALLLGLLAMAGAPFGLEVHHWGTVVSVASLLWLCRVVHDAVAPRDGRWPLTLGFGAAVLLLRLNVQLLGAEAFPVTALVAAAAHMLLLRERPALAGALVGGAMFLRLDAGLGAAVLGLVEWRRRGRFPRLYAIAGLVPLAVWLVFLQAYYGRLVPLTLAGKRALRDVPYTFREWQMFSSTLPPAGWAALLGGALVALGIVVWRGRRHPMIAALGLWLLVHEVAYRVLDVWFAPWYHVALIQAVVGLFVLAAWTLARAAAGGRRWAAAAVFALLLAPVLVPSLDAAAATWRQPTDPRHRIYAAAAQAIRAEVPPDAEVLALEIGVLGYLADRRILDLGGLVSPRFTAAKFTGGRADLAAEIAPEYIVHVERNTMLREVVEHPGLKDRYRVVAAFADEGFPHGEVRLLERTD